MKLLALTENFSHMGQYSGYGRLFHYLPVDGLELRIPGLFKKWWNLPHRQYWKFRKKQFIKIHPLPYYTNPDSIISEYRAIQKLRRTDDLHLFIAYGENSLGLLTNQSIRKSISGKKVFTAFHQPPSWYKLFSTPEVFRHPDACIALSNEQADYIYPYNNHVKYIPHGVDTEFFSPGGQKEPGYFNVIIVGEWLRDYSVVRDTIIQLKDKRDLFRFHIVLPKQKRKDTKTLLEIARYNEVQFYSGLTDKQLLDLYRKCHALFLPLIDSTANNAILESMACGLPVLTTNLPGTHDYCAANSGYFVDPSQPLQYTDLLVSWAEQPAEAHRLGLNGLESARNNFAWPVIAETIQKYLGTPQ